MSETYVLLILLLYIFLEVLPMATSNDDVATSGQALFGQQHGFLSEDCIFIFESDGVYFNLTDINEGNEFSNFEFY